MTFVHNAWYMVGWADEIDGRPLGRTILGAPTVIFRDGSGAIGAMQDVCPHRAVALSTGSVAGEHIRCPYHGLEFDTNGVCRHNPHVKGPPNRIKVAITYSVVERYGMVWLWPGDPKLANPASIPDYGWFADTERFTTGKGYLHIDADYRLVIDNLMDLAHAEYIHPTTVGSAGANASQISKVVRTPTSISVNTIWPNIPPNPINRGIWPDSELIDSYIDMIWKAPSNLLMDKHFTRPGDPLERGLHTPSAHILTPETERSTHYFWAFARNFKKRDEEMTRTIVDVVRRAFLTEDKPVIESAQRMIEATGAKLRNFSIGDNGSAQVRRELERLAKLERS